MDDHSAPLRIQAIQVFDPNLSLLVYFHTPTVPDGSVQVLGPAAAPRLISLLEQLLRDPIWDQPGYDIGVPALPSAGLTVPALRETAAPFLATVLETASKISLMDFARPSVVTSIQLSSGVTVGLVAGDITTITPENYVERIVEPPTEALPESDSSSSTMRLGGPDTLYITALEPLTWIDEPPKLTTVREHFEGVRVDAFSSALLDENFSGHRVVAFRNGVVAVSAESLELASEFFTNVFALAVLKSHFTSALHPGDIGRAAIPHGSALGEFEPSPRLMRIFGESVVFKRDSSRNRLALASLSEMLELGAALLTDEEAVLGLRLWLEAHNHLRNLEFPQALVLSWTVTERVVSRLWREFVSIPGVSHNRIAKLTRGSDWDASQRIEVLQIVGRVSAEQYERMTRARRARNSFAHEGARPTEFQARESVDLAEQLLRQTFSIIR